MQTNYILSEINSLAQIDPQLLVTMSEENYFSQINETVNEIAKNTKTKFILLAGPSSSGKTTTCNIISSKLNEIGKKTLCVSLDDFFIDREKTPKLKNGEYNFETIKAIDIDFFNTFLTKIQTEKTAYMPKFNFLTGKREKKLKKVFIDDNTIILIEGLHALNPCLISVANDLIYKIYISVESDFILNDKVFLPAKKVRLLRRMLRDIGSRGKSIDETLSFWKFVLQGEKKYIDPFIETANYKIDSTHLCELNLQANYLLPLLENNEKAKVYYNKLSKLIKINKKLISKQSVLNEFFNNK